MARTIENESIDASTSSAPDSTGAVMIEATESTTDRKVAISYNFGQTLADASAMFGEDVVFSNFRRASVVTAQGIMRRLIKAGKSDAEIQTAMSAWRPGVAVERVVDPVAALKARFSTMTEEERAKVLAELTGAV